MNPVEIAFDLLRNQIKNNTLRNLLERPFKRSSAYHNFGITENEELLIILYQFFVELENYINENDFEIKNLELLDDLDFQNYLSEDALKGMKSYKSLTEKNYQLLYELNLLSAISDALGGYIVVLDKNTRAFIYLNTAAREYLDASIFREYNAKTQIFDMLETYNYPTSGELEYTCPGTKNIFLVKCIENNLLGTEIIIYLITDITEGANNTKELKKMAFKDPLTGAYNRRYFNNKFKALKEAGQNFSLCLIDLDKLKIVNDKHGHVEGDEYIKFVFEQLVSYSRSLDIICRLGGDEFIIIFINCEIEPLYNKMASINNTLSSVSEDYEMSISYGVAYVPENDDTPLENLMFDMDKQLYNLKKSRSVERE